MLTAEHDEQKLLEQPWYAMKGIRACTFHLTDF